MKCEQDDLASSVISAIAGEEGFTVLGYLPHSQDLQGGCARIEVRSPPPPKAAEPLLKASKGSNVSNGVFSVEIESALRAVPPKPYTGRRA